MPASAPASTSSSVLESLWTRPMSSAQVAVVALCTALNIMDGFEVFASSFTAGDIAHEFGLDATTTGMFLGAGPLGMIFGAALFSPLGDVKGRRALVLSCLAIIAAGLLLTGMANAVTQAIVGRIVTGIGVGAMMASINTVVSEVCNRQWRDFCVAIQAAGFPAGAVLGGGMAVFVDATQWRWIFIGGLVFAVLMLLAACRWFPESLQFVLVRQPKGYQNTLIKLLTRYGIPTDARLYSVASEAPAQGRLNAILTVPAICMSVSFFSIMLTFFFLSSWIPKLLLDVLSSKQAGMHAGILLGVGGVVGDLVMAALLRRWTPTRAIQVFSGLTFVGVLLFAWAVWAKAGAWTTGIAFFVGLVLYGAMAGHYAVVAKVYPSQVRVSGTGLSLGIGRIGAAMGPMLGGVLLQAQLPVQWLLPLMAAPILVCIVLMGRINRSVDKAKYV